MITSAEDTFLTEQSDYGGVTSTHGSEDSLVLILGTPGFHRNHPLLKFDLLPYVGTTITNSTVDLILKIKGGFQNIVSVSLRESLVSWNEATTSYMNFAGTGFDANVHTGIDIATTNVTYAGGTNEFATFTFPSSVVQNWIDNPASNNGLVMIVNTPGLLRDKGIYSKESGFAPSLHIDLIGRPIATIDTAVEIRWISVPEIMNQVQYSTNLALDIWVDLGAPILGDGSTNQIFDITRDAIEKYYRVINQ